MLAAQQVRQIRQQPAPQQQQQQQQQVVRPAPQQVRMQSAKAFHSNVFLFIRYFFFGVILTWRHRKTRYLND